MMQKLYVKTIAAGKIDNFTDPTAVQNPVSGIAITSEINQEFLLGVMHGTCSG